MTLLHLAVAMALLLVGLLVAELQGRRSWVVVLKPLASLAFVVAGVLFLPLTERAGVMLLVGLVLSLGGDVLLIPKGRKLTFLLGLAGFLCAHVAYSIAFLLKGVDDRATALGAILLVAAGIPITRWLFPHVDGAMKAPVVGYVVAITAMVALACGAFGAGAPPALLAGAGLFYASDLCVARERFVKKSLWNGVVGLPLYYVGQLLLVHGMR